MSEGWIIVLNLGVSLLVSTQASAQDVVITSNPVELGSSTTLTCTLQGGGTGTLEYQWTIGGVVRQQRSPRSTFFIRDAGVNDSRSDYGCTVYDGDTALPEVMGTLHVLIPNFTLAFREITPNPAELNYIGQNATYLCRTLFPGPLSEDLAGHLVITGPHPPTVEESGRVRSSDIIVKRDAYERVLYFSPLSAVDEGTYRCTSTISPRLPHPFVTNGSGDATLQIRIFPPDLSVSVYPVTKHLLDIPPYNFLTLTCTGTVTVRKAPVPIAMEIMWLQANDSVGSSFTPIPAEAFTDIDSGNSSLTLNTTQPGRHTYSCLVVLNVSPAADMLNRTESATVEVIGPAFPFPPENLTILSDTLSHNQSTVQWHVTMLSYDPEEYRVLYGTSEIDLSLESDTVSSGDDITRINFDLSVELTDLQPSTTYYYRVVSNNSAGSTHSPLLSFTTIDLSSEQSPTTEQPLTTISTEQLTTIITTQQSIMVLQLVGIGVGGGCAVILIILMSTALALLAAIWCRGRKHRDSIAINNIKPLVDGVSAMVTSNASSSSEPRETIDENVWPADAQISNINKPRDEVCSIQTDLCTSQSQRATYTEYDYIMLDYRNMSSKRNEAYGVFAAASTSQDYGTSSAEDGEVREHGYMNITEAKQTIS